jgi:predicted Ser/Thr protein kinase
VRPAGERLGPYEIVQLIGKGGMGEVYRARDTRLGRDVALKTLTPERESDATALARLRSEAEAVAALNHPHIVSVLDIGEAEGRPFIVMELVEGRTLREVIEEGSLPLQRALDLAQQVAEALAAAHARGIVHRDLKPENVVLTRAGQAKVLDFGLAKLRRPLAASANEATVGGLPPLATQPGLLLGTVGYMSPEQVRGAPVDHRSDQFAFGVMLHEMIGGRRPFERATAADTLAAILREPPEALTLPEGPAAGPLRWLIERCLARDPEERYDSTRDLARDLAHARALLAAPEAPRPSAVTGALAPARRLWPFPVVALGLVALAFYLGRRPSQPVFEQISFGRGTAWAGRFTPGGDAVIYSAAWEGEPFRVYRKDAYVHESLLLPFPPPVSILAVSRTSEMALATDLRAVLPGRLYGTLGLSSTTGGAAREMVEGVRGADFGPDGELAVVQCHAGRCALDYPLGTRLYETEGWMTGPRVAPDGQHVAIIEHPVPFDDLGSIMLIDRQGQARQLGASWSNTNGLAWGPHGRELWLSACEAEGPLALQGVSLAGESRLLVRSAGPLALLDVSPKGEALVTRETRRIGLVITGRQGDGAREVTVFDSSVLADLSEDGATVLSTEIGASGGRDYSVYLRRDPASAAVRLGDGFALALSPDGRSALALLPGPSPALIAYPTRTGRPVMIAQPPGLCRGASFFPDGRRLVVARSEPGLGVRLFVQDFPAGVPRALGSEGVLVTHLQGFPVSPDGKWVAAVGLDERLALYSVDDGRTRRLPRAPAGLVPIRFLADGRSLLAYRLDEMPARVLRVSLAEGAAEPFAEIRVSDPDGIRGFPAVRFTADGRTYAYSYARFLGDLYLVKGID